MNPDEVVPLYTSDESEAIVTCSDTQIQQPEDPVKIFNSSSLYDHCKQSEDTASVSSDDEFQPVECTFLCISLPATVPDWITAEPRMVEEGFYCIVNWKHPDLQEILAQELDPSDRLRARLVDLGFEEVFEVRWLLRGL